MLLWWFALKELEKKEKLWMEELGLIVDTLEKIKGLLPQDGQVKWGTYNPENLSEIESLIALIVDRYPKEIAKPPESPYEIFSGE